MKVFVLGLFCVSLAALASDNVIQVTTLYEAGQGSVVLTSQSKHPVHQYIYSPYGNQKNLNYPVKTLKPLNLKQNQFGYTGQAADPSTSLMMLGGFRNYAPGIGRFIQPDTYNSFSKCAIHNPGAYVEANPMMFADPSGHIPTSDTETEEGDPLNYLTRLFDPFGSDVDTDMLGGVAMLFSGAEDAAALTDLVSNFKKGKEVLGLGVWAKVSNPDQLETLFVDLDETLISVARSADESTVRVSRNRIAHLIQFQKATEGRIPIVILTYGGYRADAIRMLLEKEGLRVDSLEGPLIEKAGQQVEQELESGVNKWSWLLRDQNQARLASPNRSMLIDDQKGHLDFPKSAADRFSDKDRFSGYIIVHPFEGKRLLDSPTYLIDTNQLFALRDEAGNFAEAIQDPWRLVPIQE